MGIMVKWRLSWAALIALSLLGVWGSHWVDELESNYGQPEQRLVDAVMALNFLLPLASLFWFRYLLKSSIGQQSKTILWSGWGALLVAGVSLILLYQSPPHQPTELIGMLDLWRLSSNFIWLLPLGAWAIARGGGSQPKRLVIYAMSAAALAIASFVAVQLLGWEDAKAFGPIWGFTFVVEVLLLSSASADGQPVLALVISTVIVAVNAYLLRFLIFFAGIFYGGSMFQPLLIATVIAVVFFIELFVTRHRRDNHVTLPLA